MSTEVRYPGVPDSHTPRIGKPVRCVFEGKEYPGLIFKVRSSMRVDIVYFNGAPSGISDASVKYAYDVPFHTFVPPEALNRWEWP